MATSMDFLTYVSEKITVPGEKRYKKMFGEYLVYIDDKPVILICDNNVFVKILPEIAAFLKEAETGFPYDGAKLHYVIDLDDTELLNDIVKVVYACTPARKKKK